MSFDWVMFGWKVSEWKLFPNSAPKSVKFYAADFSPIPCPYLLNTKYTSQFEIPTKNSQVQIRTYLAHNTMYCVSTHFENLP